MKKHIEFAHTINKTDFNKMFPNEYHSFALRDNFEEPVRQFICGNEQKPELSKLLEKYILLHNHALICNRSLLTIGFINAVHEHSINGDTLYPIDRNMNCNWSFEKIISEITKHI